MKSKYLYCNNDIDIERLNGFSIEIVNKINSAIGIDGLDSNHSEPAPVADNDSNFLFLRISGLLNTDALQLVCQQTLSDFRSIFITTMFPPLNITINCIVLYILSHSSMSNGNIYLQV